MAYFTNEKSQKALPLAFLFIINSTCYLTKEKAKNAF